MWVQQSERFSIFFSTTSKSKQSLFFGDDVYMDVSENRFFGSAHHGRNPVMCQKPWCKPLSWRMITCSAQAEKGECLGGFIGQGGVFCGKSNGFPNLFRFITLLFILCISIYMGARCTFLVPPPPPPWYGPPPVPHSTSSNSSSTSTSTT